MITREPVLVLNQNYQPLNICNVRRAVVLLGRGKAELMKNGRGHIQGVSWTIPLPSVIRMMYQVRRPLIRRRLSRRAVFYRDGFACQYCGKQTKSLTLDHVMPRSRRGPHVWQNVVSACIPCNHRKAGRTPKEAGMRLRRLAVAPRPGPYSIPQDRTILEEWKQFVDWMI